MKKTIYLLSILFTIGLMTSCGSGSSESAEENSEKPEIVRKKRADGTLSSMNPVDEDGYVHGVKVNFYEDGKTVHSKVTYEHGRKNGPAIWYFKSGKVYEHTNFFLNRKHGLSKKYYESGQLFEEVSYNAGEELPGKKTYSESGELLLQ
jgi:antitoxin component YwqK of YwqJK toxin-antitoxin module